MIRGATWIPHSPLPAGSPRRACRASPGISDSYPPHVLLGAPGTQNSPSIQVGPLSARQTSVFSIAAGTGTRLREPSGPTTPMPGDSLQTLECPLESPVETNRRGIHPCFWPPQGLAPICSTVPCVLRQLRKPSRAHLADRSIPPVLCQIETDRQIILVAPDLCSRPLYDVVGDGEGRRPLVNVMSRWPVRPDKLGSVVDGN